MVVVSYHHNWNLLNTAQISSSENVGFLNVTERIEVYPHSHNLKAVLYQ